MFAPRAVRGGEAFQHQGAGAFGHHEAVAVLGENGLAAASGGSFWVESAESSEKRISASGLTEASVPTHSAASVSPRRIASTPSWIAVAPEAQAVDSEIGAPCVPKRSLRCSATDAEQAALVDGGEPPRRGDAQELRIVERLVAAGLGRQRQAVLPFDLDRRDRQEQRAGEDPLARRCRIA